MKDVLTIFDIPKFLRTMFIGLGIFVLVIVFSVVYVDYISILFFFFAPVLVIILSFMIGFSRSQVRKEIQVDGPIMRIDGDAFNLSEVKSYENVFAGVTHRVTLRFHNRKKVTLAMREKSAEYDRFEKLVVAFIAEIEKYNSENRKDKIFQFDEFKTKPAKVFGILLAILGVAMSIWILTLDSNNYPFEIELIGSISILFLCIVWLIRSFGKK